jgi:glycosyltransferase involved in cell wall biosynthesis
MRIALIIPTYNCGHLICTAIDSARRQTLAPDEIIVVDDGSTDATEQIVCRLGGGIRYVRQPNRGPSAARNLGAELARTELISFLDADDVLLPGALQEMHTHMAADPGLGLVTADMSAIGQDGELLFESWLRHHGQGRKLDAWANRPIPDPLREILSNNFVATSVTLMRRQQFLDENGFRTDLRFGEDLELWARIARHSRIVCIDHPLGLRRIHASNSTRNTESLLLDIVRMTEIIIAWGREDLIRQGVRPQRLRGEALFNLGYWYFSGGRYREARPRLLGSLGLSPGARTLKYALGSLLPAALLHRLAPSGAATGHRTGNSARLPSHAAQDHKSCSID